MPLNVIPEIFRQSTNNEHAKRLFGMVVGVSDKWVVKIRDDASWLCAGCQ